jgi:hypothetical protein
MRWDSDLATVVLGLNDNVPNELGFKNFWLVKNQTGSTITKGSLVYANGTVGASGRVTVAKFIANGTIDAKYLLGITAHDLSNGEDGYVISFGKIRKVNTDTFAAGAILYPSPTTAGVWTDVEPIAPNLDMPIGFCINSHANNGTIAIRVASGYKITELHDVQISSPVDRASLYYRGGLWRDTTTSLLVSDTTSMLTPYFKKSDTTSLNLVSRFAAKQNTLNGTGFVKALGTTITYDNSSYLRTGLGDSTYLKLTGGTLTGALNGTTGNFSTSLGVGTSTASPVLYAGGSGNQEIHFYSDPASQGTETILRLTNKNAGFYTYGAYFKSIFQRGKNEYHAALGAGLTEFLYLENTAGGAKNLGIFNSNPSYNLDLTGTFNATGASLIGGTLGVTGATTLTGALTVNNATVLNEGSGDFDTRIESDGNANMVFVDASTNRVGIGTGTPSKTLDVNGDVGVSSNITANSFIKSGGSFTQFLKADGTIDVNDYLTTSSAGSTYFPKVGGTISGAVTLSTTTATPTSLLGKDGSNVVGEVTTVAQTGLMTRGSTTATTGTPSAVFTVTHGLGSNPTSVIITGAGAVGAQKLIFEVYAKNSTTFSVQVWNYDGTEAASTSVTIYWLAIK